MVKIGESNTIGRTAEDMLGFNEQGLLLFGLAFKTAHIFEDKEKGIEEMNAFQLFNAEFGQETAKIMAKVKETLDDPEQNDRYRRFQLWLEDAHSKWDLIAGDLDQ